jgi:alanine racemase
VTTHVEYTKAVWNSRFMIGCALDNEQLASFFEEKRCEYRWLLNRGEDLVPERDFRVNRVRIDGEDIPLILSEITEGLRGLVQFGRAGKAEPPGPCRDRDRDKTAEEQPALLTFLVYPTRGMEISFHCRGRG